MARLLLVEDNSELATLIASAAQARGHLCTLALTGRAAHEALSGGSFDGAVVDLLLPDVRGGEILDELARRKIPAVAVSGVYKGDRFAREATEVHGARAFFEKPFSMTEVLGTLEAATGSKPHVESEDDLPELELSIEEADVEFATPAPTPPPAPARSRTDPSLPLPFGERGNVWTQSEQKPRAGGKAPGFEGSIEPGTVARLLTAYYQARHSGELRLQQDKVLKVIYFEQGKPGYAVSNAANERFARFCERKGVLTKSQFEAVTALSKQKSVRTADEMLRVGLLTPERRAQLVEEQIKEIIWSTFGWERGTFSFAPKRVNRAGWVNVSIFPGNLILEGVLRTERLQSLRERMGAKRKLFPTADPPYALNELALSGAQAMLLAYADGTKTVEDLTALSDLSEREALATLLALELMGLIEERREDGKQRRISYGL